MAVKYPSATIINELNSMAFSEIFQHPSLMESYKFFAKKELSEENVEFINQWNDFLKTRLAAYQAADRATVDRSDPDALFQFEMDNQAWLRHFYEQLIDENSEHPLNIPGAMRAKFKAEYNAAHITMASLNDVVTEVSKLINRDSYVRFMKTEEHTEFQRANKVHAMAESMLPNAIAKYVRSLQEAREKTLPILETRIQVLSKKVDAAQNQPAGGALMLSEGGQKASPNKIREMKKELEQFKALKEQIEEMKGDPAKIAGQLAKMGIKEINESQRKLEVGIKAFEQPKEPSAPPPPSVSTSPPKTKRH